MCFGLSVLLLLNTAGICAAAEFVADTTSSHPQGTFTGKTYVKGDKIRSEGVQGGRRTITIHRMDRGVTWILLPDSKTYMEMAGMEHSSLEDLDRAAQEMADKKNLGTETINGFLCDKYQYVYKDRDLGVVTQWVARDLKFPIRTEHSGAKGYGMKTELSNIQLQGLPDSLFELPAGYRKTGLPGMERPQKRPKP